MVLLNRFCSFNGPLLIIFFLILINLGFSCNYSEYKSAPEKKYLRKGWKIHINDLDYKDLRRNPESEWIKIQINKPWQQQGYPDFYGYVWYKCSFFLSDKLKDKYSRDTLRISLGVIGDSDQLFLNGDFIGENAKDLPVGSSVSEDFIKTNLGWITGRDYKIAADRKSVHWNAVNTLMVRTYSKSETGGLKFVIPYIQMQGLEEDLKIDKFRFYSIIDNSRLDTVLRLSNQNSKVNFCGDLTVVSENLASHSVLNQKFNNLCINAKSSLKLPISLPQTEDSVRVRFQFKEKRIKRILSDSVTLPFVLIKN
jgi:alpha-galactosidase